MGETGGPAPRQGEIEGVNNAPEPLLASPSDTTRTPQIAPSFKNMDEFDARIDDVGYARYNSTELLAREAQIKDMIEGAADVALYNSGMAAIHSAIETEELHPGDVVFCASAIYGTTKSEIDHLVQRNIRIIEFDPTDTEELAKLVRSLRPRLIITETVANSKEMPVTDLATLGAITDEANSFYRDQLQPDKILDGILGKKAYGKQVSTETREGIIAAIREFQIGQNPSIFRRAIRKISAETGLDRNESIREMARLVKYVLDKQRSKLSLIIDNTLPSPELVNPLKIMDGVKTEKVIVESGTKHYQEGANQITLGVAYSDSPAKIEVMKARRIELGTYLQPNDEGLIPASLAETIPEKMKNHSRNALRLAQMISQIPGFKVYHPNLDDHKQNELATSLAPNGLVTLFYFDVPKNSSGRYFMERVKKLSDELGGSQVQLGSSFGHPNTWLSNYSLDDTTVRVAAGSDSEDSFEKTVSIFQQVCNELSNTIQPS